MFVPTRYSSDDAVDAMISCAVSTGFVPYALVTHDGPARPDLTPREIVELARKLYGDLANQVSIQVH